MRCRAVRDGGGSAEGEVVLFGMQANDVMYVWRVRLTRLFSGAPNDILCLTKLINLPTNLKLLRDAQTMITVYVTSLMMASGNLLWCCLLNSK